MSAPGVTRERVSKSFRESNSSFIMQGVIDYITGNDPGACKLRDRYVFKIIPMLNPDGVIIGNYR